MNFVMFYIVIIVICEYKFSFSKYVRGDKFILERL